jgi:hypothetical protein
MDSPLEGEGFEPSVPRKRNLWPKGNAEAVRVKRGSLVRRSFSYGGPTVRIPVPPAKNHVATVDNDRRKRSVAIYQFQRRNSASPRPLAKPSNDVANEAPLTELLSSCAVGREP